MKITEAQVLNHIENFIKKSKGKIRVTCLGAENCDGCDASITQREGSKKHFTLITGIIPNPDFLGSASFSAKDVKEISDSSILITAHHDSGGIGSMKLEMRN